MIRFDRMLFSAVHYPADYGFILETLAHYDDPLHAVVLIWESTFPGCIVGVRPGGLLRMSGEKGPDDKVLCVPIFDPFWNHITRLSGATPHLLQEILHFFSVYKDLELMTTQIEGWAEREVVLEVIEDAQRRYRSQREPST